MSSDEVYKNRDMLLGKVVEGIENVDKKLDNISAWQTDHDKKDNKRFWGLVIAILILAGVTGSIPQLTAFALEHFK